MRGLVLIEHRPASAGPKLGPWFHLIPGTPPLAFLVEGSRLVEIDPELFQGLENKDPASERELLEAVGPWPESVAPGTDLGDVTAISLNIAQVCNLSCSYCYADEGRFGAAAQHMELAVARAAIDSLFTGARGRRVTIGFIGGEPFMNRPLLYDCVLYATEQARTKNVLVGFSVTTNGTLLTAADIHFLRGNAFAVSVSLDGAANLNDLHRRTRDGSSSAATVLERVKPLLDDPGRARIAARATVTRQDLRITERIEALAAAGFTEIGVSPLRTSPTPGLALQPEDWSQLLAEMIRAAEIEWVYAERFGSSRFSNLAIALKQIHRGTSRRLPCGAAANYVSVSAKGEYFTCHRTVGDPRFSLGTSKPDGEARRRFLADRDVHLQEPCGTCWARYLCGGGCHAEVITAGRSGCDYIRGWLEYCIGYYDRVLRYHPDLLFAAPDSHRPEELT